MAHTSALMQGSTNPGRLVYQVTTFVRWREIFPAQYLHVFNYLKIVSIHTRRARAPGNDKVKRITQNYFISMEIASYKLPGS